MNSEVVFDLEKAAWPVLLVDPSGEILRSNAAAKNTFGTFLSPASAQLASLWSPENSGSVADFLSRCQDRQPTVINLYFQVGAGSATPFRVAICQCGNSEGKQLVLQLLPPLDADSPAESKADPAVLKQRLDFILQLAQTLSLDFNNALTGVLAHNSLLLGKAEPGHPWRVSLLEVEKSAARAAEIVAELAQFSRQEKSSRRSAVGNLNTVANRCVDSLRKAHGARFTYNLQLERFLFEARFDEAKLDQAVSKILDNAVDAYGVSGNGPINIQTRNLELTQPTQDRNVRLAAGTYVCVEISDAGSGIEPDVLTHIFEPFFTTKRPPHRGLGLALVYGIISNHGGGVAISSQGGKGTSARIYLPAESSLVREAVVSQGALRGSGTILVVDDEMLMLTMAETILSDFGYKVLTANSGSAALSLLGEGNNKVDLVVTDLVMPGMGGRELMDRIRRLGIDVPILCTSGYVLSEHDKAAAIYLRKPFTSTELLTKIKAVMSHHDSC